MNPRAVTFQISCLLKQADLLLIIGFNSWNAIIHDGVYISKINKIFMQCGFSDGMILLVHKKL